MKNMDSQMPCLKELNGRRALYVDGKPFIILGLQWDCDWCYSPEDMDPFFADAEKMQLNTASLLLYWREVEPEPGKYDFAMLDHRIEMARRHNLKIVLVWFASFKNACLTYAPDYIRKDHRHLPQGAQGGRQPGHQLLLPDRRVTSTSVTNWR